MKKIVAILLSLLLLCLAACGNDRGSGQTEPALNQSSVDQTTAPVNPTTNPTKPTTKPGNNTVTIYASVPDDWSAFCWAWNDEGNAFDAWPGEAMTKQGNWYVIQVPNWVENVIINNAGTTQTEDLTVKKGEDVWIVVDADGGALVYDSEPNLSDDEDTPADKDTVTVYAHVPAGWSPFCWAWSDGGSAFDIWPGEAMAKQGNWYAIEVPNTIDKVIISNCGTPQTDDLPVTKGKDVWIVVEGDANTSAKVYYSKPAMPDDDMAADTNTVTIYANVPANWLTPFCWAWSGSQNAFATWPGVAMTKSGDWYKMEVPNWVDSVIISNNGTPQSEDLSITAGKDAWVIVKANGTVSVYDYEPDISPSTAPSPYTMQHKDLKYVLIYNPFIFDERSNWNTNSLSTGYLGSMYNVGSYGFGFDAVTDSVMTPDAGNVNLAPTSTRANGTQYSVGSTRQFYCTTAGSRDIDVRSARNMTCAYVGKYCYVWSDGSLTSNLLKMYGEEFDNHVYETLVDLFGQVNWVGKEEKIHLMFYPIEGFTAGYFHPNDLRSSKDVSSADAIRYQMNLDHPMVHFNANMAKTTADQYTMKSTLAHEFQHLLCHSASANSGVASRVWLNEAMSAYIEEYLRPGIKADNGYLTEYSNSQLFRNGQSLYNFSQMRDSYGLVYSFAEYLVNYGGEDVFSNIHAYWRKTSSSTISEAKAIYNSVSADFRKYIDGQFDYSYDAGFASKEEVWMSKMTLHFYLTMLSKEGNLPFQTGIQNALLLYTQKDPTVIEGGGRIIVAVKGNSFDIPGTADSGLIYIGLDENFQTVTSYTSK